MWFLTVFGLITSSAAIWALSLPFAIGYDHLELAPVGKLGADRLCDVGVRGRRAHALEHLRRDRSARSATLRPPPSGCR